MLTDDCQSFSHFLFHTSRCHARVVVLVGRVVVIEWRCLGNVRYDRWTFQIVIVDGHWTSKDVEQSGVGNLDGLHRIERDVEDDD